MAAVLAIKSPIPSRGCKRKSPPIISSAPVKASRRPSQNTFVIFSRKISHTPNATHNGAVLPSNVALAAVVNASEEFQKVKSPAVNIPARIGKIKPNAGWKLRGFGVE